MTIEPVTRSTLEAGHTMVRHTSDVNFDRLSFHRGVSLCRNGCWMAASVPFVPLFHFFPSVSSLFGAHVRVAEWTESSTR